MRTMTPKQREAMAEVFLDAANERHQQHAVHGQQDLPRGSVAPAELEVVLHIARQQQADGSPSWDAVLLEEVVEAVAETDPRRLRAELVQVMAVAGQWVEALDRAQAKQAGAGAIEYAPAWQRVAEYPFVDHAGSGGVKPGQHLDHATHSHPVMGCPCVHCEAKRSPGWDGNGSPV